jgi:hypothetical protein
MKKTITLPLLNLITLDEAIQEILDQAEAHKKLEFVREAILSMAIEHGYWPPSGQPIYVPADKWRKVQEVEEKHRSVDYSYVIAYFWLKSLPKFSYRQKSDIIREAIKNYATVKGNENSS